VFSTLSLLLLVGGLFADEGSQRRKKQHVDTRITTTNGGAASDMPDKRLVVGTYAADAEALYWILVMAESLRSFGGDLRNVPIWVYLPDNNREIEKSIRKLPIPPGITLKHSSTPADARKLWYSGKVFAAALAESDAVGRYQLLVWLDPDVIFVKEPHDFLLPDSISLGYRPVMHKLIGSRYSEPPDEFWTRVYDKLGVVSSSIFPVQTPVDRETIRAYFNAGLLVLRPEMGVLRKWPECFALLYTDTVFIDWCEQDQRKAIFLHQVALIGDILSTLRKADMIELPESYNYSLYLQDKYPASPRPKSLDDVVMFRHEFIFSTPAGFDQVNDSSKIIRWVKERIPKGK
jgi:hypothetical protein